MWFWQRREVYVGTSMKEFSRVRDLLAANKIQFDDRAKSRLPMETDRRITGIERMGENPECALTYYVYVRKEDLEQARYLIANGNIHNDSY